MTHPPWPIRPFHALCLGAAAFLTLSSRAADGAGGVFDVKAYGAVGDGRTNDTAAINEAIAAADKAGGGTVNFPAGVFVAGSIHLKSNLEIHLSAGATIEASSEGEAFDAPEENEWGDAFVYQDAGHSHWHNSLIWGEDLTGVAITGPGRIYGLGLNRGHASDHNAQKIGNKAIALKNCRNVTLRGFTIEHGGWFGILATGVDNLTIDGLLIDTNRDGMDIDCCRNVRIANCSVNSPWDDGICLKSSFGLGEFRATENVTISDCLVSGYDEGTLLNGKRLHSADNLEPVGRIKFGTESNGGFKAVAITNCVFECSRGLALETVDGGRLEDVNISNLTMRRIFGAPIFVRLGARMRGPANTPVGTIRTVSIANVLAEDVLDGQGILVAGLPGHSVEGLSLRDIRIAFSGGGTAAQASREVPELEKAYPEPSTFGATPSWGLYVRHAEDLTVEHVELSTKTSDARPSVVLDDVAGATFEHLNAVPAPAAKTFVLKKVSSFSTQACSGVPDSLREKAVEQEQL
jgi:polygalacturonase